MPDPEYSEKARAAGQQGSCTLRLIVGTDGKPTKIRVEHGLGMGLDEKAIEAVRTWVFEPARQNGEPVAAEIGVEVSFHLYNDAKEMFSPNQLEQFESLERWKKAQVYRDPERQGPRVCPSSSSLNGGQSSGPALTVAKVSFEGSLLISATDQELISASIRQHTYSGDLADVTSQALERAKAAWLEHGYFNVQANGDSKVLSSNPVSEQVAVSIHLNEGPQYRLERITINNNREVTNVEAWRRLFPIKDGDVFNLALITKGLHALRSAYLELGHLNFTSIPNTTIDEGAQTVSLDIDVDEGKKFYVSRIDILGLDENVFQNLKKALLVMPGDVYDQRLVDLFLQQQASLLPIDASPASDIDLRLDERAGTVAITYDLRRCGVE
ncbi:MAG: TonB family protein [Terriglobales bacterium]